MDAGCAHSWKQSRGEPYEDDKGDDSSVSQGIATTDAEERVLDRAAHRANDDERNSDTGNETHRGLSHSLAHNHSENTSAVGAKSHAHAELLRALVHAKRRDSV